MLTIIIATLIIAIPAALLALVIVLIRLDAVKYRKELAEKAAAENRINDRTWKMLQSI